jgi:RND family efflux transporter MFP subunit
VKVFEVGDPGASIGREWPGRVEPSQNAELAFEVAGKVIELPVTQGQEVKKGELLAKLDARDYRARLSAAQAKLKQVQTEYERSKSLVEQAVVARAELDQKERQLAVAKADVEQARKAVEETKIRAPFSGTVAKIDIDNFQNVQAKQPLMVLQDATSLEIVTHVPERDVAAARPGLTVEERNARIEPRAQFDSIPDIQFDCDLKEVSTVADAVTQTYEVTWSIDPPEGVNILPGMTAKVILENFKPDTEAVGISVPASAVVGADAGGAFVWKVDPESMTVSKAEVTVGPLGGSSIQIEGGVAAGDLIAVSGVHELRDGLAVSRFSDLYGDTERAK